MDSLDSIQWTPSEVLIIFSTTTHSLTRTARAASAARQTDTTLTRRVYNVSDCLFDLIAIHDLNARRPGDSLPALH